MEKCVMGLTVGKVRCVLFLLGFCGTVHVLYNIAELPLSHALIELPKSERSFNMDQYRMPGNDTDSTPLKMTGSRVLVVGDTVRKSPRSLMDGRHNIGANTGDHSLGELTPWHLSNKEGVTSPKAMRRTAAMPSDPHIEPYPSSRVESQKTKHSLHDITTNVNNGTRTTPWMCQNLVKPSKNQIPKDNQTFQEVVPGQSYVFSAHYDGRVARHPVVRVIGVANVRVDGRPVYCQMWYQHLSHPTVVAVHDEIVPETHGRR